MLNVIGQDTLKRKLQQLQLPNLLVLWGEEGSGKRTVAKSVAQDKGMMYAIYDNYGVDSIRDLISKAVGLSTPTMYYLDGDKLTIQAQNALLKIAEEPPRNAYIVLGVSNIDNLLGTIRSRATTLMMDIYSEKELEEVFAYYEIDTSLSDIICKVAVTPGQILEYVKQDFDSMYNYAIKVYNNILKVSTGNAFKICNEIAFKDTKGYPVLMFLEVFRQVVSMSAGDVFVKHKMIEFTSLALRDMRVRGANKSLIFDIWVLNIRSLR